MYVCREVLIRGAVGFSSNATQHEHAVANACSARVQGTSFKRENRFRLPKSVVRSEC